jgi:hypothetical protein
MLTETKERKCHVCRRADGIVVVQSRMTRSTCDAIYGRNNVFPATVTWEEPAKCERCGKRATVRDTDDVPLCAKCAKAMAKEQLAAPVRTWEDERGWKWKLENGVMSVKPRGGDWKPSGYHNPDALMESQRGFGIRETTPKPKKRK